MKIAHEAPLSIMGRMQAVTDYDYALVHLFEENEVYYKFFQTALRNGREVILDNSIFELGTAFSGDVYASWINKLEPTWYIVPDVLDNCDATIASFDSFMTRYPNLPGKVIAVAQGQTYNDLVICYNYLTSDERVDKIAISFNHPFYQDNEGPTKYHKMMVGRQQTLKRMVNEKVIKTYMPHHLLGCGLPQEFKAYKDYNWIDSVDTSNPVIHGLKGIKYTRDGLENKESVKLYTLIEENVLDKWDDILYNIQIFNKFCN